MSTLKVPLVWSLHRAVVRFLDLVNNVKFIYSETATKLCEMSINNFSFLGLSKFGKVTTALFLVAF